MLVYQKAKLVNSVNRREFSTVDKYKDNYKIKRNGNGR